MNDRIQKISSWMKDADIQLTFITSPDNVFYFSGFLSEPHERLLGIAIFQNEEPFLICPAMEKEDAKRAGWAGEIVGHSDIDRPWELVQRAISKRNVSVEKVAIEKEHMNVERFEAISNLFPYSKFVSAEDKVRALRLVKDESEMKKIREACELADFAVEIGVQEIQEGKTELDVLAAIEFALKKKGVNEMSFSTMVLTGANAASPHGTPGMTKIQRGDLVLFDLGVVVDGYCSDITRTVAFGEINEKQHEIYQTVLKGQLAAIQASKAGKTCAEVDLAARNIIRDAGYGDFFPHRLGHGLGISVHEFPSLTETSTLKLEEGMVFTIEPGIYVPNVAGVRIEDDVYVTKDGLDVLTKFPKELVTI